MRRFFRAICIISSALFCIANSMHAVLVQLDELRGPDGQTIRLLSEIHRTSEADQKQLAAMQASLTKRDAREGAKPLQILVETPCELALSNRPDKVTTHIQDIVERSRLRKTEVQDVEIRCISAAAVFIFQHADPGTIPPEWQYNAQEVRCVVGEITFEDLKQEFDYYVDYLQQVQQKRTDDTVKEIFNEKLEAAQADYQELLNDLQEYQIDLKSSVLAVSKRLYARKSVTDDPREIIYNRIFHVFDSLFELYIFHKILDAQKTAEVAVIAGACHIQSVKSMLINLKAQWRGSRGKVSSGCEVCLQEEDLDVFSGKQSYEYCCALV